jgi:hypothetical protein
VGGGLGIAFVGAAGYFRAYVYGGRNALADHLFLGALAAATPAAHAASALATAAEFRGASAAYGRDGMGMEDAAEALASDAATGADAFALREPEVVSVFRFDLMGQAHATTPLPDANYGYKAGKLEEGTFCAVPVVGANWTIADPVPMWYVCENDWRLFVDCEEAYRGTYDARDWYGKDRLRDCLRRPEALVAAYDVALPLRRAAAVAAAAAARAAGAAAAQRHVARERHVRERNGRRERDGGVRGGVRGRRGGERRRRHRRGAPSRRAASADAGRQRHRDKRDGDRNGDGVPAFFSGGPAAASVAARAALAAAAASRAAAAARAAGPARAAAAVRAAAGVPPVLLQAGLPERAQRVRRDRAARDRGGERGARRAGAAGRAARAPGGDAVGVLRRGGREGDRGHHRALAGDDRAGARAPPFLGGVPNRVPGGRRAQASVMTRHHLKRIKLQ